MGQPAAAEVGATAHGVLKHGRSRELPSSSDETDLEDTSGSACSSSAEEEAPVDKGATFRRRPLSRLPTRRLRPPRFACDCAYVALVALLSAAVLAAPVDRFVRRDEARCRELRAQRGAVGDLPHAPPASVALYSCTLVLLGFLAVLVQTRWRPAASSPFVFAVRIFLLLLWLFQLVNLVDYLMPPCRGPKGEILQGRALATMLLGSKNSLLQGIMVCAAWIAYLRIGALEAGLGSPLGKGWLRVIIQIEAVMLPISAVIFTVDFLAACSLSSAILGVERVLWAVLLLVSDSMTVTVYCRLYGLMREESLRAETLQHQREAEEAMQVARYHLSWILGLFACEMVYAAVGITAETKYPVEMPWWVDLLVAVLNAACFLLYAAFCMVLGGVAVSCRAAADRDLGRQTSPEEDCRRRSDDVVHDESVGRRYQPTGDSEWDETVRCLAHRGFRLGSLLDFYALLGQPDGPMPHFRPQVTTTNDVVRGAIIPLSRGTPFGNVAHAVVMEGGRPTLAERMVTHHWDNRFCSLVAAVIADALEEGTYEKVAKYLVMPTGISQVRQQLASRGLLDIKYWICAFSVNQHTAICADLGRPPPEGSMERRLWERKARDSATGAAFVPCNCGEAKHFNDSPGRCEMNKFDHMMAYLADTVPTMRQVVAVDEGFEIFGRAWCIAEINEALQLRVHQALKIDCTANVLQRGVQVHQIRVEDCRASRPEDKAGILAKIADVAAFNARVQEAIFGQAGLVAQAMDAASQAAWLGRVARGVLERRGSSFAAAPTASFASPRPTSW